MTSIVILLTAGNYFLKYATYFLICLNRKLIGKNQQKLSHFMYAYYVIIQPRE